LRNVWINLSIGLYEVAGCKVTAIRASYVGELGWGANIGSEYSLYDAGLERFVDYDNSAFIG
jgi:glycine cleavage system aminomethyltransferase T